ncbi:MAG: hypothetical protein ISR59_08520 [Anaerolineales bacterium]|uniref:Uncharacterized protein n=1 Tax=Candidatus Desulfolinea nitratireducens TaxID=2841698 RepID=A0A8J6TDU3_9CHLR|nr:hypothetical protein [Candidatus Desulfolinea nitratireducens]MBL6961142.1 hypothetical protein [Anaerolineales bacterium]
MLNILFVPILNPLPLGMDITEPVFQAGHDVKIIGSGVALGVEVGVFVDVGTKT